MKPTLKKLGTNKLFLNESEREEIAQITDGVEYTDMITLNFGLRGINMEESKLKGHTLVPSQHLAASKGILGVLAMH